MTPDQRYEEDKNNVWLQLHFNRIKAAEAEDKLAVATDRYLCEIGEI